MVGLSKAFQFPYGWLLEAPRYSYGWTLRGFPVFVWLGSQKPTGFRTVRLLEVIRFRIVVRLETPGIRMVGLLEDLCFRMVRFLVAPRFS